MLTKQLKALIETSLSAGRGMDDIREILKKQGFLESAINELFAEYREGNKGSYEEVPAPTPPVQNQTPPAAPAPSEIPPTTIVSDAAPKEMSEDPFHQFDGKAPAINPAPTQTPPQAPPGIPAKEPALSAVMEEDPFHQFDGKSSAAPPASTDHTNSFSEASPPIGMSSAPTPAQAPPPVPPSNVSTPPPVSPPPVPAAPPVPTPPATPPTAQVKSSKPINVGLGGVPELKNAAMNAYNEEKSKSIVPFVIVIFLILAIMGGGMYWYIFLRDGGLANQELPVNRGEDPALEEPKEEPIDPAIRDPYTGKEFDKDL